MYSDLLESSSKDNFSFNDQSSPYDMAEVNEINNQTNFDYIFDSYYPTVSRYNTGFDLPEDCKNMSFSELFDQELFSTHENKDCKLTIKIEKEEPINPCYSADNLQDTTVSHSPIKSIENISTSTPSKSFAPKRGINRTSIKTTKSCDVERLIQNPFYEPENYDDQLIVKVEKPIIKCESLDLNNTIEQNVVALDVKSGFAINSQNTIDDSHSLIKIKDNIVNYDDKHLIGNAICESNSLISDQIVTPIIKLEPEESKDIINMEIKSDYEDTQNRVDSHSLLLKNNSIKSSLSKTRSKSSTLKCPILDETSLKITKNYGNKNLKFNNSSATKNVIFDQKPRKINTLIIKREPEEVNDIIEKELTEEINLYSTEDLQNEIDSHSLVIKKDSIQSSVFKSSTPKHSVVNETSLKASKNSCLKNAMSNNLFDTDNLSFDPMSVKMITPFIKCEPEDINDIIEHDIEMEFNQCFSFDGCQKETDNCNGVGIKNDFSSLSSKCMTSEHLSINHGSLKTSENPVVKQAISHSFCELEGQVNEQVTAKVKIPVIRHEHKDLNDFVDQNTVGMEIHIKEESSLNKETSTFPGSNACSKIESQKIASVKKEGIMSNITSAQNADVETLRNDNTLETEKKKISWEEYKAKVGKMGLSKISKDNDESDIAATNNDKLETIIEEFDRNTAEHFIGQKRKIEDKGQSKINDKEMNSEEEQELQNKRMKIEYIKKLLPSSFASEIAKTSSLMKRSNHVDDIENESTSDDSIMSNDKPQEKIADIHLKKDEKSQKKFHQNKVYSSHRSSLRSDYCNKSSRLSSSSSSSNPDDYYNRNRNDAPQNGQYNQNMRNTVQRSRDQKRVVYVGQIPIKFGKRYLYNRFKMFGTIQSLTLHKKPDFRVYYAFVTYSEKSEAERAINHGNDDESQVQLDIRFGERKQTQTPYYDLDDEWLTDWYGYNQPVPVVRAPSSEKTSFEEELQEFYKLAQIKKSNQIKSSQIS